VFSGERARPARFCPVRHVQVCTEDMDMTVQRHSSSRVIRECQWGWCRSATSSTNSGGGRPGCQAAKLPGSVQALVDCTDLSARLRSLPMHTHWRRGPGCRHRTSFGSSGADRR
jgi:hypothetical protein